MLTPYKKVDALLGDRDLRALFQSKLSPDWRFQVLAAQIAPSSAPAKGIQTGVAFRRSPYFVTRHRTCIPSPMSGPPIANHVYMSARPLSPFHNWVPSRTDMNFLESK